MRTFWTVVVFAVSACLFGMLFELIALLIGGHEESPETALILAIPASLATLASATYVARRVWQHLGGQRGRA